VCRQLFQVFVAAAGVDFMPAQMYLFRNYELRQDAFSKVRADLSSLAPPMLGLVITSHVSLSFWAPAR